METDVYITRTIPSWVVCVLSHLAAYSSPDSSYSDHLCVKEVTETIAPCYVAFCFLKPHFVMSYLVITSNVSAVQLSRRFLGLLM